MIQKLEHTKPTIGEKIREVFQASYAIEAQLLQASYFPPLHRPLEDYISSKNQFYGFTENNTLIAVIEVKRSDIHTHIQSLVVHPNHFRKGIGRRLCEYILKTVPSEVYMVETGVANEPACKLYLTLGFKEVKQWETDYGIRKIRFLKEEN